MEILIAVAFILMWIPFAVSVMWYLVWSAWDIVFQNDLRRNINRGYCDERTFQLFRSVYKEYNLIGRRPHE